MTLKWLSSIFKLFYCSLFYEKKLYYLCHKVVMVVNTLFMLTFDWYVLSYSCHKVYICKNQYFFTISLEIQFLFLIYLYVNIFVLVLYESILIKKNRQQFSLINLKLKSETCTNKKFFKLTWVKIKMFIYFIYNISN